MDKALENKRAFIIKFVYFSIILGLYYFIMEYAVGYIYPFVVAAALAMFLQPIIRRINKKFNLNSPKIIPVFFVLLSVTVIITGVVFLSRMIAGEVRGFVDQFFPHIKSFGDLLDAIRDWIIRGTSFLPAHVAEFVTPRVTDFFNDLYSGKTNIDPGLLSEPIAGAFGVVLKIPPFLVSIVVTLISCFFMTIEYDLIRDKLIDFLPKEKSQKLIAAKKTLTQGIGKLVKAYAVILFITFSEVAVGLSIMELLGIYGGEYIVIIAIFISVVDIVPVLGTGTVLVPWAAYSFVSGRIDLGIGLIVLYAVISVIRQIIEPKLVAHQAGLPSIVTVMAMFIGARVFGIFGIITLPLTVIVVKLMLDEGIIGYKKSFEATKAGDDNA